MHRLTPQLLQNYSRQLCNAVRDKNWQQVQELDLKLRPIIKLYKESSQSSAALAHELKKLEVNHEKAYIALVTARNQLEKTLNTFVQERERAMAYELYSE